MPPFQFYIYIKTNKIIFKATNYTLYYAQITKKSSELLSAAFYNKNFKLTQQIQNINQCRPHIFTMHNLINHSMFQ